MDGITNQAAFGVGWSNPVYERAGMETDYAVIYATEQGKMNMTVVVVNTNGGFLDGQAASSPACTVTTPCWSWLERATPTSGINGDIRHATVGDLVWQG